MTVMLAEKEVSAEEPLSEVNLGNKCETLSEK
jgi:hypothetical protein